VLVNSGDKCPYFSKQMRPIVLFMFGTILPKLKISCNLGLIRSFGLLIILSVKTFWSFF